MSKKYDVAAYIWPSYHYEPRVEHFWPEKDGEWYTVRRGTPRFPGHDMPRIPLLGYQDEADPKVMRQHVELALAHGINMFIMDWYWYENAPCFERQLNEGLIPALEGTDAKFYLMWANHDVDTLWNMREDTDWSKPRPTLWSGQVSRTVLEPIRTSRSAGTIPIAIRRSPGRAWWSTPPLMPSKPACGRLGPGSTRVRGRRRWSRSTVGTNGPKAAISCLTCAGATVTCARCAMCSAGRVTRRVIRSPRIKGGEDPYDFGDARDHGPIHATSDLLFRGTADDV